MCVNFHSDTNYNLVPDPMYEEMRGLVLCTSRFNK